MKKRELQQLAAQINVTAFMTVAEYLAAVFAQLKALVPRYTYERFSDDLGFGANNIAYLYAHGKRPMTLKTADRLVKVLGLKKLERRYFLQMVEAQRASGSSDRPEAYEKLAALKSKALPKALSRRQLEFFNHWYHAAILALLHLPDAEDTPEWISVQLRPNIPPTKVAKSLSLLKRLGQIHFDAEKGRLVPSQTFVNTGPEVLGLAIIRYHQQMIELARDALTDVPPEQREISAVTISVASDQLQDIKQRIQEFQRELMTMSESAENANEVFQINLQVFPLASVKTKA